MTFLNGDLLRGGFQPFCKGDCETLQVINLVTRKSIVIYADYQLRDGRR